jgi:RimJ/RimL family protein N-acetyltransferase
MGTISLSAISNEHQKAEIGYWLGTPYLHQGYCTEAAATVLKYGFEVLGLNRIYSTHMTRNPRSGKVMQKIGMKHEGHLRQDWYK